MNALKRIPQSILGIGLIFTGVGHLTTRRLEFQAQVPTQLAQWANEVVLASGAIEIALGICLLILWKQRFIIGWVTALFLTAIFWGNIAQFINGTDAFGLDSGNERFARLFLQPLLITWALLSTGAWKINRVKDQSP